MVTKQQQINYLANLWGRWLMDDDYVVMGGSVIGSFGGQYVITRQEWQQERDKMSSKPEDDNSWHERGDLPPVGCECLIHHVCWYKDIYRKVKIVATTEDYLIVKEDGREQHYHLNQITFKPRETEREKTIDEMKSLCAYPGSWCSTYKSFAEALYDAGYRKVKP